MATAQPVTNISQIFHHLVFPAETISEALAGIFDKAADKEVRAMSEEVASWTPGDRRDRASSQQWRLQQGRTIESACRRRAGSSIVSFASGFISLGKIAR